MEFSYRIKNKSNEYKIFIQKYFKKLKSADVLDIGSGNGFLTFVLSLLVNKIYGLEPNIKSLKKARKKDRIIIIRLPCDNFSDPKLNKNNSQFNNELFKKERKRLRNVIKIIKNYVKKDQIIYKNFSSYYLIILKNIKNILIYMKNII